MSRRRPVPTYRRHRPSGQAVVTLSSPTGERRDFYLGAWKSDASRAEYERLLAEWRAAGQCIPHTGPAPADLTVNELLVRFWHHVQSYYRHPDGTQTGEAENFRLSLRPLRILYGHTLARDFGPLALKAVRQTMIDSGLSRKLINQRIGRVKRCFKWAVAEQLIPGKVHHDLQAVAGLAAGRSSAPECQPVEPVADDVVEKTLVKLRAAVAGMVRFQRLTGCRPGEACRLRRCDIDMSGEVWVYAPSMHKTAWRGKGRAIAIGPKAQAVLSEFPTDDPTAYVFATRTGAKYRTHAYYVAIRRAAKLAGVPAWSPNQLRHTAATAIQKAFDLEAARAVLGHTKADTTLIYAQRDATQAARVALATG